MTTTATKQKHTLRGRILTADGRRSSAAKSKNPTKIRRLGLSLERAVAYHEAGHVVAAWRLDISIGRKGVTIASTEGDDWLGLCSSGKPGYRGSSLTRSYVAHNRWIFERRAVVSLAGYAAQRRVWPVSRRQVNSSTDYRRLRDDMSRFVWHKEEERAYLKLLEIRSSRLIDRNWPYVEAVAAALIERKRLSKKEALATLIEARKRVVAWKIFHLPP